MYFAVTGEQMRNAEKNAVSHGTPLLKLMQNAGRVCYEKIAEIVGNVKEKRFTILCGRGSNGGDGIVIAKHLSENGGEATVVFVSDLPDGKLARDVYSMYGDSFKTLLASINPEETKTTVQNCDVLIDCVFGTGFHGELEPKTAELFAFVNEKCNMLKFSIDLPSGMDSDTGIVCKNAFKPTITICLGALKTGLLTTRGFDFAENIILLGIGIPTLAYSDYSAVLTDAAITAMLPKRKKSAHKGDCGRLLNIAGSERYMGAALLSTRAALRMGVGLCTLATPASVARAIVGSIPESTFIQLDVDENGFIDEDATDEIRDELKKCTALSIGCGIGKTSDTAQLVEFVLKNCNAPIILDADGINSVADNINVLKDSDKLILTPHPAELSRLVDMPVSEIQNNRIAVAKAFAETSGAITVLKGVNTVIAAPDGRCYVNTTGNAALAKGGSGDVLTGIIAALTAEGVPLFEAATLGVYLHGLAADELIKSSSQAGVLPSDITEVLPFITV